MQKENYLTTKSSAVNNAQFDSIKCGLSELLSDPVFDSLDLSDKIFNPDLGLEKLRSHLLDASLQLDILINS